MSSLQIQGRLVRRCIVGTNGFADGNGERQRGATARADAEPDLGAVDAARARTGTAASAVRSAAHPGATRRPGEGAARYRGASHHAVASGHAAGHAADLGVAAAAAAATAPRRPAGSPGRARPARPRWHTAAAAAAGDPGPRGDAGGRGRHGLVDAIPEAGAPGPEATLSPGANLGAASRALVSHADASSFSGTATSAATHETHG